MSEKKETPNPYDIRLVWEIENGAPGTDDDPDNPFVRAVRSPFIDGKPQKDFILTFYQESADEWISENRALKWFGVFVLSGGNKVIFFPGFNFKPTWVKICGAKSPERRKDIVVDHVSLENNLRRWHHTSPNSTHHLGSGHTTDLGENRFLWFGMSVAAGSLFREVKKETVFQTTVSSSDWRRRNDAFMKSRDGAEFNIISLHPSANLRFEQHFLHFSFIVGPHGFPDYTGPNYGIPYGSPYLTNPLSEFIPNLPLRVHRVSLGTSIDIEIISTVLPGSLTERVTFTGPASM